MQVPDRWKIIKVNDFYMVVSGWTGGYLYGDSWRRSSAIKSIAEEGETYKVVTLSGTEYLLHKMCEGFISIMYCAINNDSQVVEMEEVIANYRNED